jgi:hypothetical protein
LCLEALEDRTLLTNPATPAELITAIQNANTAGGATTITLASNTTFKFTAANNGSNALPVITANITTVEHRHRVIHLQGRHLRSNILDADYCHADRQPRRYLGLLQRRDQLKKFGDEDGGWRQRWDVILLSASSHPDSERLRSSKKEKIARTKVSGFSLTSDDPAFTVQLACCA